MNGAPAQAFTNRSGLQPQGPRAVASDAACRSLQPRYSEALPVSALHHHASLRDTPRTIARARARILGASPAMHDVRDRVSQVAPNDATVLLRGETGTGKDLIARSLHEQSLRRDGPFVACSLAGIPESLLESELFGYERGAFSGASTRKPGRVELARRGTLFLDEVGDLSVAMQVKILRLLQEREYTPLGGTHALRADVRFVAATHRDLEEMVEEGSFRRDLYFRLNVVDIWTPPLRDRREDIPELARSRAAEVAAESNRGSVVLDDCAVEALCAESWPGNVRELLSFVERLVVLAKGALITADDVRRERQARCLGSARTPSATPDVPGDGSTTRSASDSDLMAVMPLAQQMEHAERQAIQKAMHLARGKKAAAARLLGIGRTSLYEKLELHAMHERAAKTACATR